MRLNDIKDFMKLFGRKTSIYTSKNGYKKKAFAKDPSSL